MSDTPEAPLTESNYRSAIKAFSWRIVGSFDTTVISFLQTGDLKISLKIGSTDFLSKIILYYLHERAWIAFIGTKALTSYASFVKAVTWRVIGSIDTSFWGWIYTGSAATGLKIGAWELLTKVILYYLHERLWAQVPIGTLRRILARFKDRF